jgi:hypothetical protein
VRQVISEEAEQACARVMATLALGSGQGSMVPRSHGRMSAGTSTSADTTYSMILPHVVAIAEEFSRRVLVLASLPLLDLTKPFLREMWNAATSKAEGNWEGHMDAWKKWHGIRLRDAPDFPALNAFIVARNAIMHGLGQLTRNQTQKDGGAAAIAELKTVGIGVNGLILVMSPGVLMDCANAARGFVVWLDLEVAARELLAA